MNAKHPLGPFVVALALVPCAQAEGDVAPEIKVEKGILFDERNQMEYETVKIGQEWWMAENLNYSTGNSWCYDNDPDNCKKYGRLYDWNSARHACPDGWHLPSDHGWDLLARTVGGMKVAGKMLKSKTGWEKEGNGTDAYGFNALPAGSRGTLSASKRGMGVFGSVGREAQFWSSSETDGPFAWSLCMYASSEAVHHDNFFTGTGFSVRCLKDAP